MKIRSIFLQKAGPIENEEIGLSDSWAGGIHDRVLLTGPNGSGKSTILRVISHLWLMVGQWLATPEIKPRGKNESRTWLREHTKGVGFVLEDIIGLPGVVGVYFGNRHFFDSIEEKADFWLGELDDTGQGPGKPRLIHNGKGDRLRNWSGAYRSLRLGVKPLETPPSNIVFLDGEERRWIRPKGILSQPIPDDPTAQWLIKYNPSENWKGQLETMLVSLRLQSNDDSSPGSFTDVLKNLNSFFSGKRILSNPSPNLRFLVQLDQQDSAERHFLDELSAGERQVLIQIFLISRWMRRGGIVLLDEPDLHLHPSLIIMLLSSVESLVKSRDGQLFITSHLPEIWERYEAKAIRIELGLKYERTHKVP